MSKIIPVEFIQGRAQTDLAGYRKGKVFIQVFIRQDSALLWYDFGSIECHGIIAAKSGGMCYFHCKPGAARRAVNEFSGDMPLVNCTKPEEFDFIVGQVLTHAGLPLIRRG